MHTVLLDRRLIHNRHIFPPPQYLDPMSYTATLIKRKVDSVRSLPKDLATGTSQLPWDGAPGVPSGSSSVGTLDVLNRSGCDVSPIHIHIAAICPHRRRR